MILKKILKFILITPIIIFLVYFLFFKNSEDRTLSIQQEDNENKSNIIENVSYTTKDSSGNEYYIDATKAEIDFSAPNILYLTKVNALIRLDNSGDIKIVSDYGKYNSENFDTIFSRNVKIQYLDNIITGEYLDFSIEKNTMIISRNIVYINEKNILKADVLELDIKTKNTKIFMYENEKKVNIKSKN